MTNEFDAAIGEAGKALSEFGESLKACANVYADAVVTFCLAHPEETYSLAGYPYGKTRRGLKKWIKVFNAHPRNNDLTEPQHTV